MRTTRILSAFRKDILIPLGRRGSIAALFAVFMIALLFWDHSAALANPAFPDPVQDAARYRLDQVAPPSPMVGEEELYLAIHKKRHLLEVVMSGQVLFSFPVATGRGNLTPEGEFRILTKVHKPYYMRKKIASGHPDNPLGTRWMGLSIDGGYKYGIHGTNRPWSIGLSASSGCIRMRNKDVEYLYRHIPLKTRVLITND